MVDNGLSAGVLVIVQLASDAEKFRIQHCLVDLYQLKLLAHLSQRFRGAYSIGRLGRSSVHNFKHINSKTTKFLHGKPFKTLLQIQLKDDTETKFVAWSARLLPRLFT